MFSSLPVCHLLACHLGCVLTPCNWEQEHWRLNISFLSSCYLGPHFWPCRLHATIAPGQESCGCPSIFYLFIQVLQSLHLASLIRVNEWPGLIQEYNRSVYLHEQPRLQITVSIGVSKLLGNLDLFWWRVHHIRSMIRTLCPFFLFISVVEHRIVFEEFHCLFLSLCTGRWRRPMEMELYLHWPELLFISPRSPCMARCLWAFRKPFAPDAH